MKKPDDGGGGNLHPGVGALDSLPEIDPGQPIRDAVIDMTEAGRAVLTHASNTKRNWSKLNGVYNAPEEHLVMTAMDQPERVATGLKDDLRTAGHALNTYANECDRLRGVRSTLQTDINSFYADKTRIQTEHPEDGSHQVDLLNDENALLDRVVKLQVALDDAQIACRTAIGNLWGEDNYEKIGDTHVYDDTVYGFDEAGYEQLTREGLTPWSPPEMWTDGHRSVMQAREDQGSIMAAKESANFLLALTGKLGWGKAKAAYSGIGLLLMDLGRPQNKEAAERLKARGNAFLGLNTFSNDPYATTGGYRYDLAMLFLTAGPAQTAFKAALKSLERPAKLIDDPPYPEAKPTEGSAGSAGPKSAVPTIDHTKVATQIARQRQLKHVLNSPEYKHGGYFVDPADAQTILDEFHSGRAKFVGMKDEFIIVETDTITSGRNHNPGSGHPNQVTNKYAIKGTSRVSIVPFDPTWKPK